MKYFSEMVVLYLLDLTENDDHNDDLNDDDEGGCKAKV